MQFSKNKIKSLEARSCHAKDFFENELEALLEIDMRRWDARAYECFFCPGWHITKGRKALWRYQMIYRALAKQFNREPIND